MELLPRNEGDANSYVPLFRRYERRLLMIHVLAYTKLREGGQNPVIGEFMMLTDQRSSHEYSTSYELFAVNSIWVMSSKRRCLPR